MQVDTKHCDYQLRQVLHVIATQPQFRPCVNQILQAALEQTDAIGAAFHTTDKLALSVTVGVNEADEFDVAAMLNQPEPRYFTDGHLLATPVDDYGVLLLTFPQEYAGDDADLEFVEAIVDGLAIAAARAEEEQQRGLALSGVFSMVDPLLILDAAKRLVLANPAAVTLFGDAAVAGSALADVVPADDLLAFVAGERTLTEWVFGEKTFVPHVQMAVDAAEESTGWVLTLHDITRFKKLNRNQHEFISIVSHDIRSPMTAIRGFGEMLSSSNGLNDTQKYHISKVMSGITQITSLLDNIQDAGRFDPETGFYDMTRVHCDLDEIAHRIVENHLLPAEKQELTVRVNVADDVPIINADKVMLERALTNLIDNAIKYTPNGSKVEVSVVVKDNSVVIGVHDNGLGISPENQKLLFQRHVRIARKEHRKIKGSGLGLFIVKSVAQRHGGDAWVESVEGQGSTFFFSIPLEGENLVVRPES